MGLPFSTIILTTIPPITRLPVGKGIVVAAGPLGIGAAKWSVSWRSAYSVANPFAVQLVAEGLAQVAKQIPPDILEVTSIWGDGPVATTLENFGVLSYQPPTGVGLTLLQALDAAVVAAAAAYGIDVLDDVDGSVRQGIASAWIQWVDAGGDMLPQGGGGQLGTLAMQVG